jgi:hypothetical protein
VRLIHRYWHGDTSPPLGAWGAALLRSTQSVTITDWTDDTLPATVRALADSCAGLVRPEDEPRHRSNVVRMALLYEMGGWWCDHDLLPFVDFTTLPFPATAAHRFGRRCTCWLAFPERHEALDRALDVVCKARPNPRGHSTQVSGEALLDRLVGADVAKLRLLVDVDGQRNPDAEPWAVHLHATARHRRAEALTR